VRCLMVSHCHASLASCRVGTDPYQVEHAEHKPLPPEPGAFAARAAATGARVPAGMTLSVTAASCTSVPQDLRC
jgi:hypothetical protein